MVQGKNFIKEDGQFYENQFAAYLNDHGIPFLFIDQDPNADKHSYALRESKVKRPDFLLYLPTIGHIFVDVKSRYKTGFERNRNTMFYMGIEEMDSLFSLQSYMLLPLWLAFIERNVNEKNQKFYMVPISILKNYKDRIIKEVGEKCFEYLFFRVPETFCEEINDISFIPANNSYNFASIDNDIILYNNLKNELNNLLMAIPEPNDKSIGDYLINNNITHILIKELQEYAKYRNRCREA